MTEETKGWQYRVVYERSAVKDRDGFKVEAYDDDMDIAERRAYLLYEKAKTNTRSE